MHYLARTRRQNLLLNAALIIICLLVMLPVFTTLLISFKQEQDVIRNPPVFFPCDTPVSRFDPTACRWALEGYERVLAPEPANLWPLGSIPRSTVQLGV